MLSKVARSLAAMLLVLATSAGALAQSVFYPVKEPDFLTSVNGLFTTGGQYRDANNGVLQDSWSMLVRWQGDNMVANPVVYDLGMFTGLHVAPTTQWQRGLQPEHPSGTPGVQLYGYEAGMLINTWSVPHRFIEGGGYNDMYGYAWSPALRPEAFLRRSGYGAAFSTQLVLQAEIAVPWFASWAYVNGAWVQSPNSGAYGDGQAALFAYLEDRSHPWLPPIALVALAWGNRAGACPADARGAVAYDYPAGVWFGASGMCTTDIMTKFYGATTERVPFSDRRFFRIHVTPQNWTNLIRRINAQGPQCAPNCPPTGYSEDPGQYRLQYAGVIAEVVLLENGAPANASPLRQSSMGLNIRGVGIYQSN